MKLNKQYPEAETIITECIEEAKDRKETFYRERANIKILQGQNPCSDLKMAYNLCSDEKFKDMIMKEIIQNKC